MHIGTSGIDIAKNVFQVHGVDAQRSRCSAASAWRRCARTVWAASARAICCATSLSAWWGQDMAMGLVKGEGFPVDASLLEGHATRYHG
jgi:hypothetical protein